MEGPCKNCKELGLACTFFGSKAEDNLIGYSRLHQSHSVSLSPEISPPSYGTSGRSANHVYGDINQVQNQFNEGGYGMSAKATLQTGMAGSIQHLTNEIVYHSGTAMSRDSLLNLFHLYSGVPATRESCFWLHKGLHEIMIEAGQMHRNLHHMQGFNMFYSHITFTNNSRVPFVNTSIHPIFDSRPIVTTTTYPFTDLNAGHFGLRRSEVPTLPFDKLQARFSLY